MKEPIIVTPEQDRTIESLLRQGFDTGLVRRTNPYGATHTTPASAFVFHRISDLRKGQEKRPSLRDAYFMHRHAPNTFGNIMRGTPDQIVKVHPDGEITDPNDFYFS